MPDLSGSNRPLQSLHEVKGKRMVFPVSLQGTGNRRPIPRPGLLMLLLLVLASGRIALAQGTSSQLPDPADSRAITRLLERYVNPTVSQWIEIENAHEAYLERFSKLRDEDIARFLEYMRESMNGVPDARTTQEFLRHLDRLRKKIKSEDSRLFNEIAQHLEEEQHVGLERVRRVRERVRLTSGFAAPDTGDRNFDLWNLLRPWENELPPEVLERVDPEIATYEERLIPALRNWRKAQESMMLALVDELQESGIGELSQETATAEELEVALEAFRHAFAKAQQASQAAADSIEQLNQRTIKSLESLAGEDHGRKLRMAYYELVSGGKVRSDPGNMVRITTRLLEHEGLDEEARELVQATLRTYRELDDRQAVRMLPVVFELQKAQRLDNPMGLTLEEIGEKRATVQEHESARKDLAERMRDELRMRLVGSGDPGLLAIIDSGGARSPLVERVQREYSEDHPGGDLGRGGPTDFLLRGISRRDLESIRANLDPEPWLQAILSTIHDDYLEAWKLEVVPSARACERAQASIYGVVSSTGATSIDPEALRLSYARAQEATARIEAVDNEFFSNLAAPLSESQAGELRRLRAARSLELYLRGTDLVFSPMEATFRRPNIITQLDELDLSPEERKRIAIFLAERADPLLESARTARDIRFEVELRMHELNQRLSKDLQSGAIASTEYGIAYRKFSDEMANAHGPKVAEWKEVHSRFVADLGNVLEEENARQLRRSWKRASNPMVYRDPNEAGAPIRQVLQLDDLTGEQAGAIATVLAEYDVAWETLSDEMATVRDSLKRFGALTGPETYDDFHVLDQRYKRLEFEREETNLRALRRLSRFLTPSQRERIRALRRLEE